MVVKTDLCAFSGLKIYPGHGRRFIRGDSKMFQFINAKCEACFFHKKNPRKTPWTVLYRRLHRKGHVEEAVKKRTRRSVKLQRAIVGASLEMIQAKRTQKKEVREAAREAALREVKSRKAKQAGEKKTAAPTKPVAAKTVPKPKPTLKK